MYSWIKVFKHKKIANQMHKTKHRYEDYSIFDNVIHIFCTPYLLKSKFAWINKMRISSKKKSYFGSKTKRQSFCAFLLVLRFFEFNYIYKIWIFRHQNIFIYLFIYTINIWDIKSVFFFWYTYTCIYFAFIVWKHNAFNKNVQVFRLFSLSSFEFKANVFSILKNYLLEVRWDVYVFFKKPSR